MEALTVELIEQLGVVALLVLIVRYLIGLFEKEQTKREQAYITVIDMYKAELDIANERYDVLSKQLDGFAERLSQLIEYNNTLLTRLELIEKSIARLLNLLEQQYRKPK